MYTNKLHNDACSEARDLINGWMSQKFCDELQGDEEVPSNLYDDPDAFIKRLLHKESHSQSQKNQKLKSDPYHVDETKSVDQWLTSMQDKLSSFTLSEYEASERMKKPVIVKDPRFAMEARQQRVREARAHREEKMKRKLQNNIEKKQTDAIAREIIRQETHERAHKKKIEEEAIQREMAKIRKQMQDLKRKHEREREPGKDQTHNFGSTLQPSTSSRTFQNTKHFSSLKLYQENDDSLTQRKHSEATKKKSHSIAADYEDAYQQMQLSENIQRFETFQKQKLMRKSMHHWIKIVLSKRAAMGKAKALAEWRLQLKTWSAWRKYFFEQAALREAQAHEKHLKKMNIHNRVASVSHQKRLLKKCFSGWRNAVKAEQYTKELFREQEETKRKMDALIGAVTSKQISINQDLVLQGIEDEDSFEGSLRSARREPSPCAAITPKKLGAAPKQSTPKQAWQVRRGDVHKLTLKQIENMDADGAAPREVTRVKQFKPDATRGVYRDRVEASKEVITQQRQMISQQKMMIDQQRRLLEKKAAEEENEDSTEATPSRQSETTRVKVLQPPKRPKSLLAMEKRAEERTRRKEELLERKRQAEEERLERLRLEDEEEKRIEEEEKRKRREELKQIKLLEIEKENERKALVAKMQQLRRKADEHHRVALLSKYGLKPWLKLRQIRDEQMNVARCHHETILRRNVIMSWFTFIRSDRIEKESISDAFYSALLRRRCFGNWLKYGETMSILEKKAEIHHNTVIRATCLRKWERFVTNERLLYFKREETATEHNHKRLLRRGFNIILMHKLNAKREEARSKRIADMRRKVAQLLPDFDPSMSRDDDVS